jgi:hypothetical protein
MENHTFGEPVPAVYYNNSATTIEEEEDRPSHTDSTCTNSVEPSWTVDVIRKGSNVVVGTIVINNTKLPPRRNKNKKVVWKLPTSIIDGETPRFGIQDYPRLWNIYKDEKKKRRCAAMAKRVTDTTTTTTAVTLEPISSNHSFSTDVCSDDTNHNTTYDLEEEDTDDHEGFNRSHSDSGVSTTPSVVNPTTDTPIVVAVAPPPGFESIITTSLNNSCSTPPSSSSSPSVTVRPPPGFS